MSEFAERAKALGKRQDELRSRLQSVLAEAGAHLQSKPSSVPGADLAEIRARDKQVTEQVTATTKQQGRLKEIENRLREIRDQSTRVQAEIRALSDDAGPIYDEIGRMAFDVYRGNPLVDQEYADIFAPLVEVNGELSGIDAEIAEQQALLDEKPFLEKMVIRGRIALLKNRRITREGSLKRLVRSAGHDIMETAFVDEIGDPKLTAAAQPYRERLEATREMEGKLDALSSEKQALQAELEKAGAGKRPAKKIAELEEEISILAQTQASIRAELASAVRGVAPEGLPAKCRPLFATAAEIEESLKAVLGVFQRLEAAADVERLEADSQRMKAELAVKTSREDQLKKEISKLKHELKSMDTLLEEKRAVRGSVDELLESDLLNDL